MFSVILIPLAFLVFFFIDVVAQSVGGRGDWNEQLGGQWEGCLEEFETKKEKIKKGDAKRWSLQ